MTKNTQKLKMNQTKIGMVVYTLTLLLGACNEKPKEATQTERKPDEVFLEFVAPAIPTLTYAFDCKETRISPREQSRWVAFDMLSGDWEELKSKRQLQAGDYYLGRVGTAIPADTGFQGYLDNDFLTWPDNKGGVFFARILDKDFIRVVFFKRDT